MKNIKRSGSGLILALMVALIGGAVGALIFDVAGSYLRTTVAQTRVYTDDIIAVGYIEKAKGAVMAKNVSSGKVLRGSANATYESFSGPDAIDDIDQLVISPAELGIQTVYPDVRSGAVSRYVKVEVLDAAYNPNRLVPGFNGLSNLPPSFFIGGSGVSGFTGENEEEQNQYTDVPGSGINESSDGTLSEIYTKYGVYLVRVSIYNKAPGPTDHPVRVTEEAFVHWKP